MNIGSHKPINVFYDEKMVGELGGSFEIMKGRWLIISHKKEN